MAQSNVLKKYLDAGVAFTGMTQTKAEALVKDLVKSGEVQTEQAQSAVEVRQFIQVHRKQKESVGEPMFPGCPAVVEHTALVQARSFRELGVSAGYHAHEGYRRFQTGHRATPFGIRHFGSRLDRGFSDGQSASVLFGYDGSGPPDSSRKYFLPRNHRFPRFLRP